MDDNQVFELTRLKLAYKKQLLFVASLIILSLIGLLLYIVNVYNYNFSLFVVAVVIIATGIIGIMTIDQKMKTISRKIKEL